MSSPCWTLIETNLFLMRPKMECLGGVRRVNTPRDPVVLARWRFRDWRGRTRAPTYSLRERYNRRRSSNIHHWSPTSSHW